MTSPEITDLVSRRLAQAAETLQAATELLHAGHYRDAINRAYYAMFYAGLSLTKQRLIKLPIRSRNIPSNASQTQTKTYKSLHYRTFQRLGRDNPVAAIILTQPSTDFVTPGMPCLGR